MTTPDREQIRREATSTQEVWIAGHLPERATTLAAHCLALLDALEQAEQQATDAVIQGGYHARDAHDADARLAAVPALVEALKRISALDDPDNDDGGDPGFSPDYYVGIGEAADIATDALDTYHQASTPPRSHE